MATIPEALELALQHHQAGQFQQAEAIYRQILQVVPDHADALHLMGVIALQSGNTELAIRYMNQAVSIQPSFASCHNNLGEAYRAAGRFTEAEFHYQQALSIQPDLAAAYSNLGHIYISQGRLTDAVTVFQEALRRQPGSATIHRDLGNLCYQLGRTDEAITHYQQALHLNPSLADVHNNLGVVFRRQGRLAEARAHLDAALGLNPQLADAHYNRGLVLSDQGQSIEAEQSFRQALRLRPDSAETCNDLGNTLKDQGKLEEAIAIFQQALRFNPDHVGALNNLGIALQDQGEIEEAEKYIRRALHVQPSQVVAHSNLLRCLSYNPKVSPAMLFEEHLRWARQHAEVPEVVAWRQGDKETRRRGDREADRRLRVGYVSPDFREHPVARFVEPLLAAHDHSQFEIFCYADGHLVDDVTRRLQKHADHWRSLVGLSDEQVAEVIQRDAIDILVDLSGHTAGNRILVFARKPAPVQTTHFGYACTTGLATMDYRMTDVNADPPGMTESIHTEELMRLPEAAWCYGPTPSPEVSPLPALAAGSITFSCFNYLAKVNREAIALWSRIMNALPGSHLLLLASTAREGMDHVQALFEANGISRDRVIFRARGTREVYLAYYHSVDIAFDPFPYNGGVTTCDALWMGVPMVSLAGNAYISRQGVSLLSNVGLPEWIAATPDAYADIVLRWANDLPGLQKLRADLRERMRRSPLTDGQRYARNLEKSYREMWRRYITPESTG